MDRNTELLLEKAERFTRWEDEEKATNDVGKLRKNSAAGCTAAAAPRARRSRRTAASSFQGREVRGLAVNGETTRPVGPFLNGRVIRALFDLGRAGH